MGDNSTTTTQSNDPYKAAKPLLDKGMGDALALYKNGGLVKPNTMSTVVPYAQPTTQGMGAITDMANANMGGNGLSGQMQSIIDNGGYNADQQTALQGIRDTATSSFDPFNNPAFKQVLEQAQEGSMFGTNAAAAGMGRYGSGAHQGVQQRELGNLTARMVGNEYNNWQDRVSGAQDRLFNAGQTAQGNIGSAYSDMQAPIESLMSVGAMNEDLMGRVMNDNLRVANEKNNSQFANIQALLAAASGAGNFGNTTQKAQGPSNTFSNIAGGLLGGGSLLGRIF